MLDKEFEKKGIYGYSESKEKKRMNQIYDSSADYEKGASLSGFVPDERLSDVEGTLERVGGLTDALGNKEARSAYHFNAARESIVPTDNEERRRRQFVLSQNVANDAINDFYDKSVKPQFGQSREYAEKAAHEAYRGMATVPGADPLASLGAARNAADPAKVINKTMERLDNKQLNDIADAYARYGGLNPESYRDNLLKPIIKGRMEDEYIDSSKPGNSLEYVARNAYNNSLTGKLTNLALDGFSQTDTQRIFDDEAMRRYNPNKAEEFTSGVGALLIDTGLFAGLGGASAKITGKATSSIAKNLASRVMAKGAARGMTGETAKRIVDRTFVNTLGTRIATSGATQGLTLGAYDATNSVVDDLLYGDGISAGKAAGSFAKGFGTGMMLGGVGTPLKMKAKGLTGGKKLAASAGVLSAESAVFTLGTEADKIANGVEVEPIDLLGDFGESTATLLAMRMAHWRPKGVLNKLNRDGHLRSELDFNAVERQEMYQAGVNPDNFISSMELALKSRYPSLHGAARRDFISNYEGLISSDALSASTRAKLLYIVENKLTNTPPVPVDVSVQEGANGALVNIKDNAGRNVERISFATRNEADAFVERHSGVLRRNRIASIEEQLQQSVDSENFFRQAGEYARETGVSVDVISNAMYKKAKRQPLDSREAQLIDDIIYRSSYNDAELGNLMYDMRSNVEQRHGLGRGALLAAIDKNSAECSVAENRALSDYENLIRQQAERMRSGVTDEMHAEAQTLIEKNGFEGYGSESIKGYESGYNTSVSRRPLRGNPDISSGYKYFHPQEYEQARRYGFPYPDDGEPTIRRGDARNPVPTHLHSHDQLARMTVKANETARRLNTDVELLYDPHELNPNEDYYAQKLSAKGWHDAATDKITINLASNDNIEDTGFTVLHEYVGHKGLANLFGEHYVEFLDEMLSRATPELMHNVRMCRKLNGLQNDYEAMDEYLAQAAEKTDKTPTERRVMERLKDFVNDALYRMRIPNVRDLDDRKISMLMSQHRKALENNTPARKHRSGVFGSFHASHMDYDNPASAGNGGSFRRSFHGGDNPLLRRYRYRFIGEKGFQNLVNAGHTNMTEDALAVAKSYERMGFPDYDLKKWTGWERGADGMWRHEIDDSHLNIEYYPDMRMRTEHPRLYYWATESKFRDNVKIFGEKKAQEIADKYKALWKKYKSEKPKLSTVVDDKLFFDAYPEYKKTTVVYKNMPNDLCLYDPKKNVFYVDYGSLGEKKLNVAVAAEMQKMIQISEGFSRAYSMSDVLPGRTFDRLNAPMDDKERMKFYKDLVPEDWEGHFERRERFYRKYGYYPELLPKDKSVIDDYMLSKFNMGIPAAQSGNVEIRNVKKRFDIPEYERDNIMAYETEDTERKFQMSPKSKKDFIRILGPVDLIDNFKIWRDNSFPSDYDLIMLERNPDEPLN